MEYSNKIKKDKGAAMVVSVIFFMFIGLAILIGIISPVVREYKVASVNFSSKKAYSIAESGVEDVIYRLKNNLDIGTIGPERTLFFEDSLVSIPTEYVDISGGRKKITTKGDVLSNQRQVDLIINTSTGISFNYGVLVGQGGVYLDSGMIYGNVYANGKITASSSSSNLISGSAISANSPSLSVNQSNVTCYGCSVKAPNGYNPNYFDTYISFGNNNNTQDIAQSFQVSESGTINKFSLYLMKIGMPSNLTIKIMNDLNGSIGSTVLATGTLSASLVSNQTSWVDVSLTTNPLLLVNQTYWLVIDGNTNSSSYYRIGASAYNAYVDGISKIGRLGVSWSDPSNPPFSSGLDYFFEIYLGGVDGSISGYSQWNKLNIGSAGGLAKANTIKYANVTGDIYCKVGISNNKTCISDQPDPVYISFPISEGNIDEWKNGAVSGGIQTGNYTVGWNGATLGPKKIQGNLSIGNGGTLTLTGNLWVTGNLVLDGGGKIKLASSYGAQDAVIVVDGTVTVSSGTEATGSGANGSYLMLLSLSSLSNAISISGGSGAIIAYAPYGTISISGGSFLKQATGYGLSITGNSSVTYESGLIDNNFSSGPSGSWSINGWRESE
jgi:hypothetical protein